MFDKITGAIKQYYMLDKSDHVIVGLSGGSDSAALLCVLNKLSADMGFALTAVHVNHNLRGEEALRDEKLSVKLCESLHIPIEVYSINVQQYAAENKMTFEEAGRTIRYECFQKTLLKHQGTKIAVAHNLNDHIETVLMNFFRGTGLSGLNGISPVRDNIIRPLIYCTKEEIDHYCNEHQIPYAVDSTNLSSDYMRNKVRLELIPYLEKEINAGVTENINRLSVLTQTDNDYLEKESLAALNNMGIFHENKIEIDLNQFNSRHKAIQLRVIRMAYEKLALGLKDFSLKHGELVLELTEKSTGKIVSLPGKIKAEIAYNRLIFKKEDVHKNFINIKLHENCFEKIGQTPYYISLSVNKPMEKENFSNTCTGVFSYDKILGNLFLRNRLPGDRIYLKNLKGSKKIKDYFIDNKTDRDRRDEILMVADEGGNILWLLDDRQIVSDKYKHTEGNKKIYIQLWRNNNE